MAKKFTFIRILRILIRFFCKNIEKINQYTEINHLEVKIVERVARRASKLRFSYKIDKESEGLDIRIPYGFRG